MDYNNWLVVSNEKDVHGFTVTFRMVAVASES